MVECFVFLRPLGLRLLDGSFEQFISRVQALPVSFSDSGVDLTSLRGEQLHFGWKGPLQINGKTKKLSGFKHYDNPYCSAKLGAETMDIRYGLDVLKLHFDPVMQEEKPTV